jgi:cyclopropane fatty-acyl-phospholipid synthase-like methyltransferase
MNNARALLTPADRIEMSRYIDLQLYHAVERTHPFYVEMIEELNLQIARFRPAPQFGLLEIGAGTGLATDEFLTHDGVQVTCVDFDQNCCDLLAGRLGDRVTVRCDDAVSFRADQPFDIAVSVFAHDHIHYDRAKDFARNIRQLLKKGGYYLMGGEILPFYQTSQERYEALHLYHGFIIEKALRDGHFELAQIEINALKSGIQMIGDFKRHEALFEEEMAEGFELVSKTKMGPTHREDVGGVFVYTFKAV